MQPDLSSDNTCFPGVYLKNKIFKILEKLFNLHSKKITVELHYFERRRTDVNYLDKPFVMDFIVHDNAEDLHKRFDVFPRKGEFETNA